MAEILDPVWHWFEWLHAAHGINLTIAYDAIDRSRFALGLLTTITLSVTCIVLSLLIGAVGAWLQQSRHRLLRVLVDAYIQFFRNTPPLIQLYFFYFAVDPTVAKTLGSQSLLDGYGWAVVSLSFFAGAFNVEIFRAGIAAIPPQTIEAAEALGYDRLGVYRHVVLPLAFRVCLPSLSTNLINLVKTTTVAYAIAVPETLYVANQIWSDSYNVFEMMNVVWLVYLALVGVLVWLMHRLEKAIRIRGWGQSS
ncbi:amino acid ABC transporter permease [Variovorax boronicumulans]